jgi:hypothetical protein
VLRAYQDRSAAAATSLDSQYGGTLGGTGEVLVTESRALAPQTGRAQETFAFGEGVLLESLLEVRATIRRPIFRYTLDAVHCKTLACLDSFERDLDMAQMRPGTYRLRTLIPEQNLMPGAYTVNVAVCRRDLGMHLFFRLNACRFRILQPRDVCLHAEDHAVVHLASHFSVLPDRGDEPDEPAGPVIDQNGKDANPNEPLRCVPGHRVQAT